MKSFLLWLSRSKSIQELTKKHGFFRRFSSRFVAGDTLGDAILAVKELNSAGIIATLDHLGENTTNAEEAKKSADSYIDALREIKASGVDSNVSLKLTQMGIDISDKECAENVSRIIEEAKLTGNFVRIDMESSAYTDRTIGIFIKLHERHGNVGIVIQSYLKRSDDDVEKLSESGVNIRIVKGAYKEPASIAFARKLDVDENFVRLVEKMLSEDAIKNGCKVAIATHDEKIIKRCEEIVAAKNIGKDHYEFQMLYGIRRDLQKELSKNHHVRVYVPYGTEWYPYFMRRLAERPANLLFLLKNLLHA